jgi:hypothetical protein
VGTTLAQFWGLGWEESARTLITCAPIINQARSFRVERWIMSWLRHPCGPDLALSTAEVQFPVPLRLSPRSLQLRRALARAAQDDAGGGRITWIKPDWKFTGSGPVGLELEVRGTSQFSISMNFRVQRIVTAVECIGNPRYFLYASERRCTLTEGPVSIWPWLAWYTSQ